MDVEFAEDVVDVSLDRANAEDEIVGDLLVRGPLGDHSQDFPLAWRQFLRRYWLH